MIGESTGFSGKILSGMRLIEISAFVAAPLGGMTLGQLGADVIRIDSLDGGLDYRRWPVSEQGASLFWHGLNKSKRSVALDLTSEEGREIAAALISAPGPDAGMLLTNFPARGWLDYEALARRRADLIQLTIMGDRNGGSAVDYTVNPKMGLPYLTGPVDCSGPVNHVLPAWDLITGNMAAAGLLAAERHRQRTGQGQHVKLALEDVALAVMGHLGFIAEAQLGATRHRYGNHLFGAFGQDFLCADGQRVMVVALTRKQWKALCRAADLDAGVEAINQAQGLDLAKEGDRFLAREDIAELVRPWIAARSFSAVAQTFDSHGVCWGRYQSVSQLVHEDPACSVANPLFSSMVQPGIGTLLTPGTPLQFSKMDQGPAEPAPALGEHTESVLFELLKINQAEYGLMKTRGVVR